jgi:spermidine synthase
MDNAAMRDPRLLRRLLCAVFFASGVAALVFETLWFHQAGIAVGNSVWASSLVLSAFMAGLALGNVAAGLVGDRLQRPIRVYAGLEAAVAVTGVALVFGLPAIGATVAPILAPLADQPLLLGSVRFGLAFVALLVPSTAMGMTLPLLTRALTSLDSSFGEALGRLYGWNTAGALFGVLLTEALLLEWLGVRGAAFAAATVNGAAALGALWLSRRSEEQSKPSAPPAGPPRPRFRLGGAGARWMGAAFLSGMCLLALEVVWFRFQSMFVHSRTLSFAVMLMVVLGGIALGGFAAGTWLRRTPEAWRFAGPLALLAGALVVASYAVAPFTTSQFTNGVAAEVPDLLRLALPLMAPVCIVSGMLFTLVGAGLRGELATDVSAVGALAVANTTGAALGPLLCGFWLLPTLGMEGSFLAITAVYGVGVGALLVPSSRGARPALLAAAVLFVASVALFPAGQMRREHLRVPVERWTKSAEVGAVAVHEGLMETIIYVELRAFGGRLATRLITNGLSMSMSDVVSRRYMKAYVYLPIALHPEPRKALLISYGVGSTAKALVDSELETIDVVDISKDVLDMGSFVFPDPATAPLSSPKVRAHVEDGRYFLQTTTERYDLITSEPPPPRAPGVVNLYTREYFELIRERLADGGMVTYWLPIHALGEPSSLAIVRAFCDVFDDCTLWNGMGLDLMLVGSRGATGPGSEERFARQWKDPVVAPELRSLGFERPEQLGALFVGGPEYLRRITASTPPLVDDFPKRVMSYSDMTAEGSPRYFEWRDTDAARQRFETDPVIARLWPEGLREASLPWFRWQDVINRVFLGDYADDRRAQLEAAHRLLTETSLEAATLWLLGSDADLQRIVSQHPEGGDDPGGVTMHRGLRALSERRYSKAASLFEAVMARADGEQLLLRDAHRYRMFALCMDGRGDEARTEDAAKRTELGVEGPLPPFWEGLWALCEEPG